MVQCVLQSKHEEEEHWLKHNIFHTKDTVKEKECNIIINEDNYENVAIAQAVEKLDFPTQMHPQPYAIAWLKKRNKISVDKLCLAK